LHVSELLARIQSSFGVTVDRESLVSSLSKKVARQDRFLRTQKNTFSRRPDDFAGGFPGYRRRLALRLPSIAHLPACCSPSSGLVGVFGPALPNTHHLGQRRPASQLERGVFSAFAL